MELEPINILVENFTVQVLINYIDGSTFGIDPLQMRLAGYTDYIYFNNMRVTY